MNCENCKGLDAGGHCVAAFKEFALSNIGAIEESGKGIRVKIDGCIKKAETLPSIKDQKAKEFAGGVGR